MNFPAYLLLFCVQLSLFGLSAASLFKKDIFLPKGTCLSAHMGKSLVKKLMIIKENLLMSMELLEIGGPAQDGVKIPF